MRHFHKLKNHYHCPIVNLDKLWTLVGEEVRTAAQRSSSMGDVNNTHSQHMRIHKSRQGWGRQGISGA